MKKTLILIAVFCLWLLPDSIAQAYPNPSNGRVTITHDTGETEVAVYDALGRRVSAFLTAGIYFYRIGGETGSFVVSEPGLLDVRLAQKEEAFAPSPFAFQAADVTLPVEVISWQTGAYDKAVTFSLANPSEGDSLYLQLHRAGWRNPARGTKAYVRLNGGVFIPLRNDEPRVRVAYPENVLGGIGGVYHTVRVKIAISDLGSLGTSNILVFRFAGTDGVSAEIGFRVVDLNIQRADGTNLLTTVYDDPSAWQPIHGTAAAISEGRDLWLNKPLKRGATTLQAKCQSCHDKDGRDLAYFAYSDSSIVAISRLRAMTQLEAEKVASYIRSIQLTNGSGQTYSPPGRPWNPPYQPAPGLDSKPVHEWSAGGGVEWVLDSDSDVLPYVFPDGVKLTQDKSTKGVLNLREIPIDLQLPDWNNWLPQIHPSDGWGAATWSTSAVLARYNELVNLIASGASNSQVVTKINQLGLAVDNLRNTRPAGISDQRYVDIALGLHTWQDVKLWEALQQGNRETAPSALYPGNDPRGWIGVHRTVFNTGPHIADPLGLANPPWQYGSLFADDWMTHAWYQLQMILNAGHRVGTGANPMDWNYQFLFINKDPRPQAMRQYASHIKVLQSRDNGAGINTATGWRIYDTRMSHMLRAYGSPHYNKYWAEVSASDRTSLSEVILRTWLRKTLEYPISAWPRGTTNNEYEPATYTPVLQTKEYGFREREHANNTYTMAFVFRDAGVAPTLIDSLAAWGSQMWPLADWKPVRCKPTGTMDCSAQPPPPPPPPPDPEPDPDPDPDPTPDPDPMPEDPKKGPPDKDKPPRGKK